MRRMPSSVFVLCALVLGIASDVYANPTGNIAGIVRDGHGTELAGVTIVATSDMLEEPRFVVTGLQGDYRLPFLEVGEYMLTLKLAGFVTGLRTDLLVVEQETLEVDVVLSPSSQNN